MNLNYLQKIVRLISRNSVCCAGKRFSSPLHSTFFLMFFFVSSVCFAEPRPRNEKLWAVSVGMEQVLTRQLVQTMRKSVPTFDPVSQSSHVRFFQGMLDESYADTLGERGELGVAQMVYDYLEPMQYQGGSR